MYQKNNSRGARRPGSRFGGASHRSSGRFQNRPKHNRPQFRDVSKFINKATPVVDSAPYQATHSFVDFAVDERLKKNVLNTGYTCPTPIQDQAIPQVLLGRDVVGIANTGTGKTAAFLIPLLDKVIKNKNQKVLVIAPTRELALQINQELAKFSFGFGIFSVCVVGGMPIFRQMNELRRSHNFVVGTPGRIKDLVDRGCIRLSQFQTVVLDEADRMLDMGFIGDMRTLMAGMPDKRHTVFFSATLSQDIKRLIGEFLNDPVHISVKTGDTSCNVDQDVVYVKDKTKIDILHDLLIKPEFDKVIIFGQTKHGVEKLSNMLSDRGFKTQSIHGNKNHSQRQKALNSFKDNSTKVLVATDVAARGLDIPNVSHVINYELPSTHEDYIHRIGRTGRGGNMGKALTFID
jgi:ATP-dependent RNA helicase RhlE